MPTVWIPSLLRELTGGQDTIEVEGQTVREVIEQLDRRYPGFRERLVDGDRLRPTMAVLVDGRTSQLKLRQPLSPSSEVHFVPVISGG